MDITIVGKDKVYKLNNKIKYFYHGGVDNKFNISDIDIYRKSEKQQNKNNSYVGFYMYDEDNYIDSIKYAIQQNNLENTNNKGVIKISMNENLQVYTLPPFTITRLTKEQLEDLKNQGYDLVKGKMLGKDEYVLLNKSKVISIEFLSIDKCIEDLSKDSLEQLKEEVNSDIKTK